MTFLQRKCVLVTGGSGFVGRALLRALETAGADVRVATRSADPQTQPTRGAARAAVGDIGPATQWDDAVSGVDIVFHLAARVHRLDDRAEDPLADFRAVNVEGTARLAEAAARAGVRRLVFASSIKVCGESTAPGHPFDDQSPPLPIDPYGISKLEAEQRLASIAAVSGLEVAILRPVLMYGPGVRGNMKRLVQWVRRGLPLPFASIGNRRSLLAVDNFADAMLAAASHPAAVGSTFVVSDGEDLSTPELIRRLARALRRPARLLPCPPSALLALAALVGRRAEASRLVESLQVDSSRIRRRLDWLPPVGVDEGIAAMLRHDSRGRTG